MTPVCYRFPDRATWLAQGRAAGLLDAAGAPLPVEGIAIADLGQVEVCGPAGDVLLPVTYHPGYHVNLLHPDPPAVLDPYLVVVSSARCIFSGWPAQSPDDVTLSAIEALA